MKKRKENTMSTALRPITKGEYMRLNGIEHMSHVDPEEVADKDFMDLIDVITGKENMMDSVTRCPCHTTQKTALEIIEEVKSDICDKICKYREQYDQETLLDKCCDGCPLERLA